MFIYFLMKLLALYAREKKTKTNFQRSMNATWLIVEVELSSACQQQKNEPSACAFRL